MSKELYCEFEQSFAGYVLTRGASVDDQRPMVLEGCLLFETEKLLMMEAHDLAAILSGVIKVANAAEIKKIRQIEDDEELSRYLRSLQSKGKAILVSDHSGVSTLLDALIDLPGGAGFYATMAQCLHWAGSQKKIRPYLCR